MSHAPELRHPVLDLLLSKIRLNRVLHTTMWEGHILGQTLPDAIATLCTLSRCTTVLAVTNTAESPLARAMVLGSVI